MGIIADLGLESWTNGAMEVYECQSYGCAASNCLLVKLSRIDPNFSIGRRDFQV